MGNLLQEHVKNAPEGDLVGAAWRHIGRHCRCNFPREELGSPDLLVASHLEQQLAVYDFFWDDFSARLAEGGGKRPGKEAKEKLRAQMSGLAAELRATHRRGLAESTGAAAKAEDALGKKQGPATT